MVPYKISIFRIRNPIWPPPRQIWHKTIQGKHFYIFLSDTAEPFDWKMFLDGTLPEVCFMCLRNSGWLQTWQYFIIGSSGKINRYFPPWNCKLDRSQTTQIIMVSSLTKEYYFVSIRMSRWQPLQDKFNFGPIWEQQKVFLSEIYKPFDRKHSCNVPWMVLELMSDFLYCFEIPCSNNLGAKL